MKKMKMLKRYGAFLMAFVISVGMFSDRLANTTDAKAESIDNIESKAQNDKDSESFDITSYAQRLKEIAEEQAKLDKQIAAAKKDINREQEKQKAILEKVTTINEKCTVLNAYLTQLEIEMTTNQVQIDEKQVEIENGIEDFKKRLRAMYLAGDSSYTSIIASSGDFFDVLMRVELVKRVADHDNDMINNLIEMKDELEKIKAEQLDKQSEYDEQLAELNSQKEKLSELYNESAEAKAQALKQKKNLEKQNLAYIEERKQFEADLSGILISGYGDSTYEVLRATAEVGANTALTKLRKDIKNSVDDGEELLDTDCRYVFQWPVPNNYYVSSGVGERWGSYHTGIDITGGKGTNITASESGKVLRVNSTCVHDYAKKKSCGCGGGYGNYIIVDHGNDFITLYGHLTELNVEEGDIVKKGDVIGYMGSTGFSTGNHLHFEIRYQGYFLNPAAYVSF